MTRYPAFLISQISMKCVLSSWRRGDKRLEEAHRPIGFIHFCLLSADRGGPSPLLSPPSLLSFQVISFASSSPSFTSCLRLCSSFIFLFFCLLSSSSSCHKSVVFLLFFLFRTPSHLTLFGFLSPPPPLITCFVVHFSFSSPFAPFVSSLV